ncbi:MAG: hypothetical protein ABIP97_10635 [Chthoniobacterales bacterium]
MKVTLPIGLLVTMVLSTATLLAQHSNLPGLSKTFLEEYQAASKEVAETKSADPYFTLQKKYPTGNEWIELEVSIGLVYGQRTGMVDPAKAVQYFTSSLKCYGLSEITYSQILMWRGNSQEQLGKIPEALNDYLRGLLECSYRDLSGGWPEIKNPYVTFYMNSSDPENDIRAADYNQYRRSIESQRFFLRQCWFLVDAVRRVTKKNPLSHEQIIELLAKLSPDSSRYEIIVGWLKSENKRPWP